MNRMSTLPGALICFGVFLQTAAAQKPTVVVYVNGINTDGPAASHDRDQIQGAWAAYSTSKGITAPVSFEVSYNYSSWWLSDLLEATRQLVGQYGSDLTQYYYDPPYLGK